MYPFFFDPNIDTTSWRFYRLNALLFVALRFIRQTTDVTADMEEMETEFQQNESPGHENHLQETTKDGGSKDKNFTMMDLLRSKELRIPLLITVFLQVIQQLSGINAVSWTSSIAVDKIILIIVSRSDLIKCIRYM